MLGYHHVALTVTDVVVSEQWYRRVFGLQRVMVEPHPDSVGYAVVLARPGTALFSVRWRPRALVTNWSCARHLTDSPATRLSVHHPALKH